MAALNTCSADLVRAWDLDLERHRTMTRRPVWSNRAEIVRRVAARYPGQALFRGDQGIVNMRVMLDAEGRVTDCQLERATSAESLVSPACREMQQARFLSALDGEGKAMKSFYAVTIVYKIAR
jgi:TonB family protein